MQLSFAHGDVPDAAQWGDWRWQVAHAVRNVHQVEELLGLRSGSLAYLSSAAARYPLFATPYYLSLAKSADLSDPVLRQCLPDNAELTEQAGGEPDALAEEACSPVSRLVHRYPDRVLYVTGNFCAVRCRHCLRKRDWERQVAPPSEDELALAADYLRKHTEVREVLISGGDPLMLPEESLRQIVAAFSAVPSIEMLRFGSRVPVVLPQRVTPQLAQILAGGKPAWLATHFNHPQELTAEAAAAADTLLRHGIGLVNQSVLLKGVNDSADCLGRLFTGLLRMHVKPYYLFHGDPITGAMHFRTGIKAGLALMDQLRGKISGMALPAFAFDLPGGAGKIRLQPEHILRCEADGTPVFMSYDGRETAYPN